MEYKIEDMRVCQIRWDDLKTDDAGCKWLEEDACFVHIEAGEVIIQLNDEVYHAENPDAVPSSLLPLVLHAISKGFGYLCVY